MNYTEENVMVKAPGAPELEKPPVSAILAETDCMLTDAENILIKIGMHVFGEAEPPLPSADINCMMDAVMVMNNRAKRVMHLVDKIAGRLGV